MYHAKRFLASASVPISIHTSGEVVRASMSFVLRSKNMARPLESLPFLENDSVMTKQEAKELLSVFKEKNRVFLREIKYNKNTKPVMILREVTQTVHRTYTDKIETR